MPFRLNLDVSCLGNTQMTGIGNYAKNLISELEKYPEIDITGSYKISRWKKSRVIAGNVKFRTFSYWPFLSDIQNQKFGIITQSLFKTQMNCPLNIEIPLFQAFATPVFSVSVTINHSWPSWSAIFCKSTNPDFVAESELLSMIIHSQGWEACSMFNFKHWNMTSILL